MWNKTISSSGKQSSGKSIWFTPRFEVENTLTHFGNSWCMTRIFSLWSPCCTLLSVPRLSLHSFDDFPGFSPLSLLSYPLKKTEIGSLAGVDIIYPRLLFKSYKIPGFKLYTEKQSNTSAGNHPSLGENRPVQTACSTYLTHKDCESKGDDEITCCVALERMFTLRDIVYTLSFFFFFFFFPFARSVREWYMLSYPWNNTDSFPKEKQFESQKFYVSFPHYQG